MRQRLVFLTLLIGGPVLLGAQVSSPVVPVDSGREVRVTTMAEQMSGRLLARYERGDPAVRLCTTPWNSCGGRGDSTARRTISVNELLRLEVRRGDHGMTGFLAGAVTGALLGSTFVLGISGMCDSSDCGPRFWPTVGGGLAGAVSVGFLGGLIGTMFPKWSRVQ